MTKFLSALLVVLLWTIQAMAMNCPTIGTPPFTSGRGQIHAQIVDMHPTPHLVTIDSIRTYQKGGIIYAVWGARTVCPGQGCSPSGVPPYKMDCSIVVPGYTIPSTTKIIAGTGPDLWYNWNLFDDSSGDVNTKSVSLDNTTKPSGTIIFTQADVNQTTGSAGPCAAINLSVAVPTLRTEVVYRTPDNNPSSTNVGTGLKVIGLRIYAALHPNSGNLIDAYSVVYVDSSLTFTPDAFMGSGVTNDCKTDFGPWYDTYWKAIAHGSNNTISEHLEPNVQLELYQSTVAGTITGDSLTLNQPATQPSNTVFNISGGYGGSIPSSASTYTWSGGGGCTGGPTAITSWVASGGTWHGQARSPTTTTTISCTLTITGGGPNTSTDTATVSITGSGGTPSQTINNPGTQTIGNNFMLTGTFANGAPNQETYTLTGSAGSSGTCPTFSVPSAGNWRCAGIPVPGTAGSYTAQVVGQGPNGATSNTVSFTVQAVATPTITLNPPGSMLSGSTGNAISGTYTITRPTAMTYTFAGATGCAAGPTAVAGFSSATGTWNGTVTAPTVGSTLSCNLRVTGTAGNTASSPVSPSFSVTLAAQTITINPVATPQSVGNLVTITGTYSNGIPSGLRYTFNNAGGSGNVGSFTTSGGTGGTWSGTVPLPTTPLTYRFNVRGIAGGANTAVSPQSNAIAVQPPIAGGC